MRGMAGNTKNEVKKYKAQEKALDKKLAALAKSKRQQDARVARAKGRAAKAKQRAAKVEKVVPVPSRITPSTRRRPGDRRDGVVTRHRRDIASDAGQAQPGSQGRPGRADSAGRRSLWKSASTP